jgi:hypothetical protein
MLTVGDVARWLALGEGWVREHAAELGGVKLGDDPRAPLRFTRAGVQDWIESRRLRPLVKAARRRVPAERVKLLPLPRDRR